MTREGWLEGDETLLWECGAKFSFRLAGLGLIGIFMLGYGIYAAIRGQWWFWGPLLFASMPILAMVLGLFMARGSRYYVTTRRIVTERGSILRWSVPLRIIDEINISNLSLLGIASLHFVHHASDDLDWALVRELGGGYKTYSNWLTWSLIRPTDAVKAKQLILETQSRARSS